jgi:dTDP-4-dehydrorhamnose 3,5-epimerase
VPFDFRPAKISGLVIVEPAVFSDNRGAFFETYKKSEFVAAGIVDEFFQDNQSISRKGTLRGLHFQRPPHAQAKLVRVVQGAAWDVAVDLRKGSPTYLKWFGLELSAESGSILYIPAGFTHGFLALEDDTAFVYKCSLEYNRESEGGIRWDDPDINISWPAEQIEVSEKDASLPYWREQKVEF